MIRIFIKNLFVAFIYISVAAFFAIAIILTIGLAFEMFTPLMYVTCIAVALLACIILRDTSKTHLKKIDDGALWQKLIDNKKFLTRMSVFAIYLPCFAVSAASIVLAVLLDPITSAMDYKAYASVCGALSGCMVGSIYFAYYKLKSLKICKKCGAVNSLVIDDSLDYVMTTGYQKFNMPGLLPSRSYALYRRKATKSASRVACHCAKCGKEAVINDDEDSNWYWL